jgi:hypothetical protein
MAVTQANTRLIRFGTAADAITNQVYIQKIVWLGPTTAGHNLVISDADGVITAMKCNINEAGGRAVEWFEEVPFPANGITITTLDSGTVDVYTV